MSLPIFAGGRNRSNYKRAQAAYEEAIAQYRQRVLIAFGEVESSLAGIQHLLSDRGIPFRVVSSPFPSRVCTLISELDERVAKAVKAIPGPRRVMMTQKALAVAAQLVDERDAYAAKLDAGKDFMVGDDAMDAKWTAWARVYVAVCDALRRSEAVLKP